MMRPISFACLRGECGPGVDYHHDLSAHHADGSPPLLIWMGVFPRRRQRVVKHEGRSLEAEAVRSKIRLILCLAPRPTQAQSPFTTLRNCSYKAGSTSILAWTLPADIPRPDVSDAVRGGRRSVRGIVYEQSPTRTATSSAWMGLTSCCRYAIRRGSANSPPARREI